VRRPDDLLVFDVTFGGFTLATNPPRLQRASGDSFIVIEFPPQSFGEEAYPESKDQTFDLSKTKTSPKKDDEHTEVSTDPNYPKKNVSGAGDQSPPTSLPLARVRMSGPSRVGVSMPAELSSIGYDLASILTALRDWPMRLDRNAASDVLIRLESLLEAARVAGLDRALIASQEVSRLTTPEVKALVAHTAIAAGATATPASLPISPDLVTSAIRIGPHEPAPTVTALELPYRLLTSPLAPARWLHALAPVTHRAWTELWHTRLAISDTGRGVDGASRIRTVWSPDYRPKEKTQELIDLLSAPGGTPGNKQPNPDLIRMSLDPLDRSMLVTLMAGYDATVEGGGAYQPLSSEAKRLHLTSLGALIDVEGTWATTPDHVDLEQWRHLSTLGRDHYVRVMYAGYLWPFGHAASLIKVTERKFESLGSLTRRVALLRQRFFIVVREPARTYTGAHHKYQGRNFPFTRIELLTRVTPDLSDPGMGDSGKYVSALHTGDLAPRMLFWPMVPPGGGALTDVPFEIRATDISGQTTTFAMPLLFVGKIAELNKSDAVASAYNAAPAAEKRSASTGGAVITYAPADPSDKGDPRLPTKTLTFAAAPLKRPAKPMVYPEVDVALVGIKPIQKLLSQPDYYAEVTYPGFYKDVGLDATKNKGQIFLKLTQSKDLSFGGGPQEAKSDALGALATPKMSLLGLSKIMGPVSGDAPDPAKVETALGTAMGGRFEPKEFFKDATLLGGIKIAEILPGTNNLAGADAPKMVARDFPDRVEARFEWATDVTSPDKANLLVPRADKTKPPTRLTMNGVVRTPLDPKIPASAESTATITNFKVNLFGFIILWFEEVVFVSKSGQKPDVTVRMRDSEDAVRFGGPLEFVNEIRRFIPGNGFSDPPGLTVTPSGLSASYSLTLPSIGVGIFALSNASLGAAFSLPFDSNPVSVRFNFSTREHPFSLTVSLLGGGGFFAIGVTARGVNEIEAALEFGAALTIDLGVASGGVEVKAGIYFHWLEKVPNKGSVELAGYVRIHGELTVLGIISVSLTFNLQLGYLKEGGKGVAYGEATLTVEIEILMFSAEVSVSCRKEFAGGEADPRFIDLMPTPQIWSDYCDAFADEAA
jgi:hypothetical protein